MSKSESCERESSRAARKTTVVQDFPRDNSSLDVKDARGRELGGSATNLEHSLRGASAVMQDKSKSGAL